jgi:hypothetical protein
MTDRRDSGPGFFPVRQEAAFTPREEEAVKTRLWKLLQTQVKLQTQGDHTSLREEAAAELLRSLTFTLQFQFLRDGLPAHALLTADLPALLKAGQRALQTEVSTAQTLYAMALRSVADFGSVALRDTLLGIGQFFRRYDARLYAHEIPADIDYPLCLPVAETLQGVVYVREYLERLLIENRLLARFAPERAEALLRRASPDYRGLLQNMYEPVAANAVGLSLLGKGETPLEITHVQAAEIHRLLAALPSADALGRLTEAAAAACRRLSVSGEKDRAYLAREAETLLPRITLSPQSASGVFSAC